MPEPASSAAKVKFGFAASTPGSVVGSLTAGGSGSAVSIVQVRVAVVPVLPAVSIARTLKV
jgi:hypothetical protein